MINTLINPVDKGYIDISNFKTDSIAFFDKELSFVLNDLTSKQRLKIKLNNIVSCNYDVKINRFYYLRLDSDGSSYGLDISIKLKQPVYKNFMVLYLFEDENHTRSAFRGLAEKVIIEFI